MGRPRIKTTEYKYKENNRRQKEQLINSINDDENMTVKVIKELTE